VIRPLTIFSFLWKLRVVIFTTKPDLDCPDINHKDFTVLPPGPHNLDGDNDVSVVRERGLFPNENLELYDSNLVELILLLSFIRRGNSKNCRGLKIF
jgi:hypothetical protein